MITDKNLKILGVVAAVLVVLSAWVGSREPIVTFAFDKGQLLIPDLEPERVDAIEAQHGEDSVKIRRAGTSFLVESLGNYPASMREVNTLMRSVLDIKCASEVSEDAETHVELGVAEGGEDSTTVRFLDADGNELVAVVVADSKEGHQYVRVASSDTVYRTDGFVSLRSKGLDFVDKQLLEIKRDEIVKVDVAPKEGKVYAIESPEEGEVVLQGIPEGKKQKDGAPDGVFGAATWLNFTDFQSEAEIEGLEFVHRYTVATRGGAEYALELAQQDDKWWVRGSARYTGPARITVPELPPDATDEQRKANDEQLKENEAFAAADKAVKAFNGRHQSWVYEISSWKAESMTKALDDLVEDDDGKPEKVAASHILIPYAGAQDAAEDVTRTKEEAQALAEEVLGKVQADPGQFADLAKEYSSCSSAESGGDLGENAPEGWVPEFSDAAFALQVDEVSGVVESPFGFHIIKRTK